MVGQATWKGPKPDSHPVSGRPVVQEGDANMAVLPPDAPIGVPL